jgi:hypothetical protein
MIKIKMKNLMTAEKKYISQKEIWNNKMRMTNTIQRRTRLKLESRDKERINN